MFGQYSGIACGLRSNEFTKCEVSSWNGEVIASARHDL
jgi:hypothetical protein